MEQVINRPLVSIITVCFNSDKTIRQTIESVLNQTYTNIEYIIVDGKSTDSTVAIIEEYVPLFAERGIQYRWVSEPDNGIYDAMNKGIKMATGEYVNFQGADDWLELYACEKLRSSSIRLSHSDDYFYFDVVMGIARYILDGKTIKLYQSSFDNLLNQNINHQATFYHSKLFDKYGKYSLHYKIVSDFEFNIRIRGCVNYNYIDEVICNYSMSGISSLDSRTMLEVNQILRERSIISFLGFLVKYVRVKLFDIKRCFYK